MKSPMYDLMMEYSKLAPPLPPISVKVIRERDLPLRVKSVPLSKLGLKDMSNPCEDAELVILVNDTSFKVIKNRYGGNTDARPLVGLGEYLASRGM